MRFLLQGGSAGGQAMEPDQKPASQQTREDFSTDFPSVAVREAERYQLGSLLQQYQDEDPGGCSSQLGNTLFLSRSNGR